MAKDQGAITSSAEFGSNKPIVVDLPSISFAWLSTVRFPLLPRILLLWVLHVKLLVDCHASDNHRGMSIGRSGMIQVFHEILSLASVEQQWRISYLNAYKYILNVCEKKS